MTKISASLKQALLLLVFCFVFCFHGRAQEASRPDRGIKPNGSHSVSEIENINLLNGNLNLRIPLASLPPIAGGKLSWTFTAQYNSKLWDITRSQGNDDPLTWAPYTVNSPGAGGGWTIGNAYSIHFRNANDDFQRLFYPGNSGVPAWDLDLINNNQWWKVLLRMPDGSEHEFRPTDHSSYVGGQDFLRGFYKVIPTGSPLRYYSVDGTYMFATISSAANWTVYLPDGTRIIQTPDGVQRIQDTNGNKIKIFADGNGTHYQDEQTGREIRLTYNPAGQGQYRVWYNTVGGSEQHIDINMGTTTVRGKLYSITWPGCEFGELTEVLHSQLEVVREIVFPQTEPGQPQRKFTFDYNSDTSTTETDTAIFNCPGNGDPYTRTVSHGLGELSQMITPSGAIVDYSYTYDGVHTFTPFGIGDYLAQEKITEKKITHDGTEDTWTYDIGDSFGTVTNPDGSTATEVAYCSLPNTPGCATDKAGLTYRSVQPFRIVERHWTNLMFSGADNLAPNGVIALNPVVDKEYTTLTDAAGNALKMSAKVFAFDFNGNVIQETHYDWFDPQPVSRDAVGVPTGVPAGATVLRVINHSHYNQAATAGSGNVYAKRSVSTGAPLILNATKETTIGPGIVRLSYDAQAYGVAPTVGNLTATHVWVDQDALWITTTNTYDSYGNVLTATDGRGKVTQFFYDDSTHALPTRVVVDPENGTGPQTTTTAYDFATGLVLSQTDVNGQQSTIDYTNQLSGNIDPFNRPGITKSPTININGTNHRRRVTTTYLDSARQVIVAADLNAENDKLLKTRTTVDMLGRPVLTEQTEDGTNYTISVKNAYLNMGRVTLTSSALRSTASTTDSWTRITNDNGGRVTEVATFGGATQPAWSGTAGVYTGSVTSAYAGNSTTVTDQAGKVRRSIVDAAGRLIRVDEPDASGNLGSTDAPVQPTNYLYDVFDNLTKVIQGVQERTFNYDSLSRLRTATNPESGTISYKYDNNGNLTVKTDARGVSAHFAYDSLNRVTRRWYNGSNSTSHTIHNDPQHPIPAGVGPTNEAKFYYDTQIPPSSPIASFGASVGRVVAQTYGAGTNGDYFVYDALGRPTRKVQQVGTVDYEINATYTLSGAVSTLTYPSRHIVTNQFDQAGRLTSFAGELGDGSNRTYSTGVLYSPSGGLVREQFGTTAPIYNKLFYNSRGQLAEIRASTSDNPTDSWDRGAIINNYSTQCTGVCSGSIMSDNNGNLRKQEIHIPNQTMRWQEYNYDSLSRLKSAREVLHGGAEQWKQEFIYDRYGNRTIDTVNTYGPGINNTSFDKQDSTNRLFAPGDLALPENQRKMRYDPAGNLTHDIHTGAGNRTYDSENKITSAWGGNNQAQLYAYDASGQRIKRTVNGIETWQIYGLGGELLAEYAANAPFTSPQKEYGYRNGQLLITATPPVGTDRSLSVNGTSAYVQVANSSSLNITGAITVEAWIKPNSIGAYQHVASRETFGAAGTGGGYELTVNNLGKLRFDVFHSHNTYTPVIGNTVLTAGQWYHVAGVFDGSQMRLYVNGVLDATVSNSNGPASGTSSLKLGRNSGGNYFNGLIDEVRISNTALYTTNFTPQMHLAASANTKGLWKFDSDSVADSSGNSNNGSLQSGAAYSGDIPTGPSYHSLSVNGTNAYVQVPNSSSLNITGAITVEAWIKPNSIGTYQHILSRETFGVAGTGGGYELTLNNVGKLRLDLYHSHNTYTPVIGNTVLATGEWHHIAGVFDGSQMRLYVNGVLDASVSHSTGPASGTSSVKIGRNSGGNYFNGLIDEVRVSNAALYSSNFTPQSHLTTSANTRALWKFDGHTTADSSANDNNGTPQNSTYSDDVPSGDGGGGPGGSGTTQIHWLISDHLGTPRMVFDISGSLESMKRHDYLPFGEELFGGTDANPGTSGRKPSQGYGCNPSDPNCAPDDLRMQFTSQERDLETELDYFHSRYYSSILGRFTSADPDAVGAESRNPQSWNGYTHGFNNPQRYTDPLGLAPVCTINGEASSCATVINNIRTGNFRVTTVIINGKRFTVNRSDYEKVTHSQKADGTLVSTTTFNQTAFLRAAAVLANMFQQAAQESEKKTAVGGFGGGGDFGGGGAGGCWCDTQNLQYVGAPYHGDAARGGKNPAPSNGQAGLDNSVRVKETSPRRVGVDQQAGQFVVYDQTRPGEFHGHVRSWQELTPDMKNALIKSGMATQRGKIITPSGAK